MVEPIRRSPPTPFKARINELVTVAAAVAAVPITAELLRRPERSRNRGLGDGSQFPRYHAINDKFKPPKRR